MSLLFALLVLCSSYSFSLPKTIQVSCSESDADIYIDGKQSGVGSIEITLKKWECRTIRFEKVGFKVKEVRYCNDKVTRLQKSYYIELAPDEAYNSSSQNALANTNFEVRTDKSEDEAWKLISQIVMEYNDIPEVIDGKTGYMRTGWDYRSFNSGTVRTRIIVRQFPTDNVGFKIKIVSEFSSKTDTKDDEEFEAWNRILRKYENLIPEVQSRVK